MTQARSAVTTPTTRGERRRRPRVAAAILAIAVMALAGCSATSTSDVAASSGPAAQNLAPASSPQQAVAGFLSAVVDGRSSDAESLLSPEATDLNLAGSWLTDPPPLIDVQVGTARPDDDAARTYPAYADVTFVPVTFYLDDTSGRDGFAGGDTMWGYLVGKSPASGWLILGSGPF